MCMPSAEMHSWKISIVAYKITSADPSGKRADLGAHLVFENLIFWNVGDGMQGSSTFRDSGTWPIAFDI